ncbi:MAG: MBL fold metallo-hydrolase [Deltaproteobacteria bacterium]|nr:MBL fold metallo-hydrolase [Deltaproteobacteria bacterium]
MIEELQTNIYCVKIPLPLSPLKNMNSYILKTDYRNLIIDTGLNHQECLDAMQHAIAALSIDMDRTDLFITHFHIDHFGLVPRIISKNTRIYFNRIETELQDNWEGFTVDMQYLTKHGFPEDMVSTVLNKHPAKDYFPVRWPKEAVLTQNGDRITVGPFQLECIHTPGHSPGHMCLYEKKHKILFCGDHLLADISPIITCWSENENRLGAYLNSLYKTKTIDVNIAYPGHHNVIHNHKDVIEKILTHHANRLSEACNIIVDNPQTAFTVASNMHWNFNEGKWDSFPDIQKLFATSEALAHLRHLELENKIQSIIKDGKIYFFGSQQSI